jgi:hypothetical protein
MRAAAATLRLADTAPTSDNENVENCGEQCGFDSRHLSRRTFLKGAAVTAGALFLPPLHAAEGPAARKEDHSIVVTARSDEIRGAGGELLSTRIKKLLDESLCRLTGKTPARDAWRSLFAPQERVTIKVGCLPGAMLSTRPEVVRAIIEGLTEAGVKGANIIVWDRSDSELSRAGYEVSDRTDAVKVFGTDHFPVNRRYTPQIERAGDVGAFFSTILAALTDAVISVPVLKDHDLSGVSLSMKNFFGAIHNPNKYHTNRCDPYIGHLMTHRFIKDRLRLVVIDGTLAQAHRGPAYAEAYAGSGTA